MTVKELKKALAELPACYDDLPVVTFQAQVEQVSLGYDDEIRFTGFDDVELKRVKADIGKVRIN